MKRGSSSGLRRRIVAGAILALVCSACDGRPSDDDILGIGSAPPAGAERTGRAIMIGPARVLPSWTYEAKGIPFILAVQSDVVVYATTKSEDFESPEGAKIGDSYERIRQIAGREATVERGWAYVVPLPSGWNAGFLQGRKMTEGPLADDAEAAFFFRRAAADAGGTNR